MNTVTFDKAEINDLAVIFVSRTLTSKAEKTMLMAGLNDGKQSTIENGISEKNGQRTENLDEVIANNDDIVGFYQDAQSNRTEIE